MTAEQFCYWLQGSLELGHTDYFDANDIRIIQDHLNLVFKKETPNRKEIKLPEVIDKHNDSQVKPFEFLRTYIGKPPFDFNNPPVITC